MAPLVDSSTQPDTAHGDASVAASDAVDASLGAIEHQILSLAPKAAMMQVRRCQARIAALETKVVATVTAATGSDAAARRMLNDGKRSKAAIAKAAKRGDVAAKNPGIVDKLASGDLSSEHVDVIADTDTDAKTNGAASADAAFIAAVAATNPDQAKAVADRFVADKTDPDGLQSDHDRQRNQRRTVSYRSKKSGLAVLSIEGDAVSVKHMADAIAARANQLYNTDGGRDLESGKHPRTTKQRSFDAAHELIAGVTTTAARVVHTPRPSTKGNNRPQIFVSLSLDKYLGLAPGQLAEHLGLGVIPDSVLAEYLEHADIIGALYDRNGHPLWLGRARRHASLMQRYALIARDKACVLCNAPHASCQVHHLAPWTAPAKGPTDLDNLALLCGQCHRQLHANNHTLFRNQRTWRTRPATPTETPPTPINQPQRE